MFDSTSSFDFQFVSSQTSSTTQSVFDGEFSGGQSLDVPAPSNPSAPSVFQSAGKSRKRRPHAYYNGSSPYCNHHSRKVLRSSYLAVYKARKARNSHRRLMMMMRQVPRTHGYSQKGNLRQHGIINNSVHRKSEKISSQQVLTTRSTSLGSSIHDDLNPSEVHRDFVRDPLIRGIEGLRSDESSRPIYKAASEDHNQPKLEANLPDGLLSVSLLRHQKIALAWMLQKENRSKFNCPGGILADDQGLGKTISMIALIQMQRSLQSKTETCTQTTLVVCPASVIGQWARELDDKVTEEAKLSVLVYHGGNRTKNPKELASYDVVLTTYAIVTNECPRQSIAADEDIFIRFKKRKKGNNNNKRRKKSGPLARVDWYRVILDEAHTIKNDTTQVAKACCRLRAKTRWCLSGTPIQNSIDDLYSYFRFLKYHPYGMSYDFFEDTIKAPISLYPRQGYKELRAILRSIMLRRTKGTIIDGQPILNLPPKTVNLSNLTFSTEERAFYNELESGLRAKFKKYAARGILDKKYENMLLRLRQACDHPLLVGTIEKDPQVAMETSLSRDMLIHLLNVLEDSKEAICGVCDDVLENPVVTRCGHVFCFQCVSQQMTDDENDTIICPATTECDEQVDPDVIFSESTLRSCLSSKEFNTDPDVTVMLMSLKAGNLGLNMVSASHVILLDPWWNPTTEDQAVDRTHRIGQTRPVTVIRLTIKDTVEDRMLALQDKKREMIASALGEDNGGGDSSSTRLTVEDLKYLFRI